MLHKQPATRASGDLRAIALAVAIGAVLASTPMPSGAQPALALPPAVAPAAASAPLAAAPLADIANTATRTARRVNALLGTVTLQGADEIGAIGARATKDLFRNAVDSSVRAPQTRFGAAQGVIGRAGNGASTCAALKASRCAAVQMLGTSGWRLLDQTAHAKASACRLVAARHGSVPGDRWVEFPVRLALADRLIH